MAMQLGLHTAVLGLRASASEGWRAWMESVFVVRR